MIDGVTGVVNAGGRGLRLGGARKALLRNASGETLIARTLAVLRGVFPGTLLIANEREPYSSLGVTIAADRIADRGAPGGLHAALSTVRTPWIFFAACDMPRLDARVIEALGARRGDAQACVAMLDGRPEPLHAFWSVDALPALEDLLAQGQPSFRDLLDAIPVVYVEVKELERAIPGARDSFANVNTPEDLATWGLVRGD